MSSQSPDFENPEYEEPRAPDNIDLEAVPEDGIRELHPFTNISGFGQGVQFADYAPKPLPSDAPEEIEEIVVVPKDSSAPGPVSSSDSVLSPNSESPVSPTLLPPTLPTGLEDLDAELEDGQPNPSEPLK